MDCLNSLAGALFSRLQWPRVFQVMLLPLQLICFCFPSKSSSLLLFPDYALSLSNLIVPHALNSCFYAYTSQNFSSVFSHRLQSHIYRCPGYSHFDISSSLVIAFPKRQQQSKIHKTCIIPSWFEESFCPSRRKGWVVVGTDPVEGQVVQMDHKVCVNPVVFLNHALRSSEEKFNLIITHFCYMEWQWREQRNVTLVTLGSCVGN